jgi:hypothetical protein
MAAITSQTFHHVPSLNVPRGAQVAAQVFVAGLRLLARLVAAAPAALVQRSRAQEAEDVRALADRYAHTDPSYAADLYAAAARHEAAAER